MNLYITYDQIGIESGGGLVTAQEIKALDGLGEPVVSISRPDLDLARYQMPDSPFLQDWLASYLVSELVKKGVSFELAHFYSGGFSQTVRLLKAHGVKVTYTVAAHDRKVSVSEFLRLGMAYPFSHIREDHIFALYKAGYLDADLVIAPSKASAAFLEKEGCQRIAIIPHGVELPAEAPPLPKEFAVGYLGAVGPDKGVHYLLQAWSKLAYPDAACYLGGRDTERLGPYLQSQVPNGKFKIMGWVAKPVDMYSQISVYVQPSVSEGFGIEILEALAHGRPVVVSEGAGAADLVDPSVGFTVPIRDSQAIADKLRWLREHPEELVAMGARARERAAGYTWERIRGAYVQAWRGLDVPAGD